MIKPDDAAFRSPLLGLPGAVPADAPNLGVAGHYGDPIREQRQLAEGRGWVDLSHRDVVRIEGPDRLSWLHNLTTQRLDKLEAGVGAEALVLSPQGRVEHHLQLVDDGEATWIHLEPGAAAGLVEFLDSMRFMLRVDVAEVTAEWAVIWQPSIEPDATYLTRVDPQAANTPPDAVTGRQLFVPRAQLNEFASQTAAEAPAGVLGLEALRIEAGRPRFGVDTDDRTIPHEMGWIGGAVQLNKGCYRGQETVAHVANLGRPPRRLVRLHLDGSVRESLPAAGTPIASDGVTIGRLTSSAYHYELGPIALGVVKYATADDIEVSIGSVEPGGSAEPAASSEPVAARIESIVERDDTPRPGQAARAAFARKSLL